MGVLQSPLQRHAKPQISIRNAYPYCVQVRLVKIDYLDLQTDLNWYLIRFCYIHGVRWKTVFKKDREIH